MAKISTKKIKPKRPKAAKATTDITSSPTIERTDEASVLLELCKRKLRCTYPIIAFDQCQAEVFANQLVPIIRRIDGGKFWKGYDLKVLHLRSSGRAVLFAELDGTQEKIILSASGVSSRQLLHAPATEQTVGQAPSRISKPFIEKISTETKSKAKAQRREPVQFLRPDTAMSLALKSALGGSSIPRRLRRIAGHKLTAELECRP